MPLTENLKQEIARETNPERCRRKRDQAWEMAGCARVDRDLVDEQNRTEEAQAWAKRLGEI